MSRPSLRDVAARAGTSTAVVSYVVNDGPRPVAAATRERVQAAIRELGYRPDHLARALRSQRTGTVGLLVPDLGKAFFAQLADAVETAALTSNLRLLIATTHFDQRRETDQLHAMLDARVDGVIIAPSEGIEVPLGVLAGARLPTVVVHRHLDQDPTTFSDGWRPRVVVADDTGAGRQAAEHLLAHGHRVIACLTGPVQGSPVQRRTDGFRAAMRAGLGSIDEELILRCDYADLAEEAYQQTARLLESRPSVSAICATTDEHALGVIRAATHAGRHIGKDLALLAIDGTNATAYLTPPLTVLQIPFAQLGVHSIDALLNPTTATPESRPLPLALIRRSSCGCNPQR